MSREEYMRFHSVRRWVEQCECSAYTEPVMDVSDRWCGSVYGQIISPSRPIPVKGTMEMLSTHFLLVSSDSDAVLYSIEVDAVKSIHRVDYTHFPSGNLAGGNGLRSSSRKGGGSDDDDQHQGRAPPGRAAAVAGGGGGSTSSYLRTVVELLVAPLSEVGRKAAAASSSSPLNGDEEGNDDGKEAYGEEDLVRILVSLDGPEGRHFAAGMEMLWCMRFERLSLRQRAISRSSHTSDVVYILSMLPLDVSCELLQIHEPQPGSTHQQESSLLGASSRRILGNNSNNNNNTPPPMSITNVSKPVNLRITEDYKICVVFRPDTAYAGMAAAHAAYADLLGPEDPHPSTIFLKAMNFHMDNVLLLTVTNNQLRVALRSGTVYVFGSLDLFGLDKDKSSNSSSNQVQTSDGSRGGGGGGVPQRGSMSPMGSPGGVNEGSMAYDDTSDDRSSFNFNATFTAPLSPRFPASNNATVTFSQEEEESGLPSIPQYEAPPLIKARRKTADEFTKAVSGVDVAGMSRGVRCVLDVYLLFAATSCYQSLYLKAASAPHMGKTQQQQQQQTPNRRRRASSKGTPIGPLTSSNADASNTDDDIEPGKVIRDQIPTVALPDYIPNRRCFRGNDIYIIYQHFLNVDSNYDGCLSSAEFLSCIGPALVGSDGALPRAVYSLFDVLHNDVVQVAEYFFGCRVLLKGSVEDRLLFLFNGLFDTHQRGVINYQQFHSGMSYVSKVLRLKGKDIQSQSNGGGEDGDEEGVGGGGSPLRDTSASNNTASSSSPLAGGGRGLSIFANRAVKTKVATHGDVLLSDDQLRAFTREVFRSIDTNGDQEVDFQEFCVGMTRNQGVIRALQQDTGVGDGGGDDDSATGSNQDILSKFSKDDPSREVGNPLKIVSFGHPKWKEVVLILAGIETSVGSSEAGASTVSQKSYGEKVIHDCSQFGNIAPSVEALLGSLSSSSPSSSNNNSNNTAGGQGGGGSQSKRFSLGGRGGESATSPPSSSEQAPLASPRGGSSNSKAQSVLFNDYCPAVFCAIRRAFGITQEAYTKSLGLQHLRSNLLFGSLNTLFAMSSSGRSGSFFYASHDFKFILKTIPGSESEMLRKILPSYYAHIIKYEHTLLTRFCGLHALHVDGKKLNFVVMQNIFQNKIPVHVSYDLKGSTVNRSTPNILRGPGVALKDNDFGKRRVYMRADLKAQLMRQLDADSAMLTSYNLNDYSFLLGVHESVVGPLPMCDKRTCPSPCHNAFQRFHGGIEGRKPIDLTADPNPQLSAMHSENQVWTMGDDHEDDDGDEWTMVRKASPIHEMHARKQRPTSLSASVSIGGWHGQEVLEYAAAESGLAATAPLPSTATTTTAGANGTPTNGTVNNNHTMQYEVYFMGVIDILTDYGMKKKGEHHAKSILYDSKQVSCVPPQEYRQRYLKYLDMIIEGI